LPQGFNINPPIAGLNINVRSVLVWFWPSFDDRTAEVTPNLSHYVEYEAYPQNNQNGIPIGRGHIDCGVQSAMDMYQSATIQELMTKAFS
jgi:hypothetical protein